MGTVTQGWACLCLCSQEPSSDGFLWLERLLALHLLKVKMKCYGEFIILTFSQVRACLGPSERMQFWKTNLFRGVRRPHPAWQGPGSSLHIHSHMGGWGAHTCWVGLTTALPMPRVGRASAPEHFSVSEVIVRGSTGWASLLHLEQPGFWGFDF